MVLLGIETHEVESVINSFVSCTDVDARVFHPAAVVLPSYHSTNAPSSNLVLPEAEWTELDAVSAKTALPSADRMAFSARTGPATVELPTSRISARADTTPAIRAAQRNPCPTAGGHRKASIYISTTANWQAALAEAFNVAVPPPDLKTMENDVLPEYEDSVRWTKPPMSPVVDLVEFSPPYVDPEPTACPSTNAPFTNKPMGVATLLVTAGQVNTAIP